MRRRARDSRSSRRTNRIDQADTRVAGERRPHHRGREDRVLESGRRDRANVEARRRWFIYWQLVRRTGAREQGESGRRAVAADRPRLGSSRSGFQPGAADRGGDRREAGRGSPASSHLRRAAAATSGISQARTGRSRRRSRDRHASTSNAAVTNCAAATCGRPRAVARKDIENAPKHRSTLAEQPDSRRCVRASMRAIRRTASAAPRWSVQAGSPAPSSAQATRLRLRPGPRASCMTNNAYPTWRLGVRGVSYPLGQSSSEEANHARSGARSRNRPGSTHQERRITGHPAGARRRLESGDERQADRYRADGARARRAAPRRRTEAFRGGHVDELPGHPGAARPGAGTAGTGELAAISVDYDLSLVDFEALQRAAPAGQSVGVEALPRRRRSSRPSTPVALRRPAAASARAAVRQIWCVGREQRPFGYFSAGPGSDGTSNSGGLQTAAYCAAACLSSSHSLEAVTQTGQFSTARSGASFHELLRR